MHKISVRMICETADVNRSTFYAHYIDQRDLFDNILKEAVDGIRKYVFKTKFVEESENAILTLIKILDYCKENKILFKVILTQNESLDFKQELIILAQDKAMQEHSNIKNVDSRTKIYVEEFTVAGVARMIQYWLENDCVDDSNTLATLITDFLYKGVIGCFQG